MAVPNGGVKAWAPTAGSPRVFGAVLTQPLGGYYSGYLCIKLPDKLEFVENRSFPVLPPHLFKPAAGSGNGAYLP